MYDTSVALLARKGADYNRDQQQAGDTLFNIRVCELLGIVPAAETGLLVRISDKIMRLVSLTQPGREAAITEESVLDTIRDLHNYLDFLGLLWQQRRCSPRTFPGDGERPPAPDVSWSPLNSTTGWRR
jgi:hypothetical protein